MVLLDGPDVVTVKSNPVPDNETWAAEGSDSLMTVKAPVWCPATVGKKAICTTQVAAGSRDVPQVVDATSKPADADNLSSDRRTVPLFVSVTDCGVLADPTPMVGNVTDPG
jgi:hypothetical protein